jgi:hypothetical protein
MEEKESHLAGSGAHENERTAKKKKENIVLYFPRRTSPPGRSDR